MSEGEGRRLRSADRPALRQGRPAARCAGCGAALADRQRWCLECGTATGVAVATTPRWRPPAALAAAAALLALAGLGYVVAALVG